MRDALVDRFADVSEQLSRAVHRMQASGVPPAVAILKASASCRRDFACFRAKVLRLAESLDVDVPSPSEILGLADFTAVLEAIARVEDEREKCKETRRHALSLIAQALDLKPQNEYDRDCLLEFRSEAQKIQRAIDASPPFTLSPDAGHLAEGDHPLASLLLMVRDPRTLDDETWTEIYGTVSAVFGKRLAVAAARGRILLGSSGGSARGA